MSLPNKILEFLDLLSGTFVIANRLGEVQYESSGFSELIVGESEGIKRLSGMFLHQVEDLSDLSQLDQSVLRVQKITSPRQFFFLSIIPLKVSNETNIYLVIANQCDDTVLERQAKLESLGSFAGEIAHDLNNVLTGVLGHVSYLRLALPPSEDHQESIQAIEEGARRAAGMSKKVLRFVRGGENAQHRALNLTTVLDAVQKLLTPVLPEDVLLHVLKESQCLSISGDESQLSQLVMNLIINARDALSEGGDIWVELNTVRLIDNIAVERGYLPAGDYVVLSVRDNGVGIEPAVKNRIFEPFFTTKLHKGTGLGLATVFNIVRSHEAGIVLNSVIGRGTEFQVYFPLVSTGVESSEENNPAKGGRDSESDNDSTGESTRLSLPTGSERVLIVDDEESVRSVMQRSLEILGYQVDAVSSGREGIERYKQIGAGYSLVILDMMMPEMSGDEVFFNLKKINSTIGVLVASGFSSDEKVKAILNNGGLGLLQKPFDIEELARVVRSCIDKKHVENCSNE